MAGVHAERAAQAERLVVDTYVRRVRGLPGTALGRARPDAPHTGPSTTGPLNAGPLNYWWQAHLLDALLDAEARRAEPRRRRLIRRVVRSVPLRNGGWCNDFHDDMAWLLLALQRTPGRTAARGRRRLLTHLLGHRGDDGLLTWRCTDHFHNVPANATAAIGYVRGGDVDAAARVLRWIDAALVDPVTGLVLDGVQGDGRVERAVWTYNQGVVLGALVELADRDPAGPWRERAATLVDAVGTHLAPGRVLVPAGGGDGGLFAGITARYLALAAVRLGLSPARELVTTSAAAVWAHRDPDTGRFPRDWSAGRGSDDDDLSVQLSAWLLLEAAATL